MRTFDPESGSWSTTDWSEPLGIAIGWPLNPGAAIPAVSADPDVPAVVAPDSSTESIAESGTAGPIDPEICFAG